MFQSSLTASKGHVLGGVQATAVGPGPSSRTDYTFPCPLPNTEAVLLFKAGQVKELRRKVGLQTQLPPPPPHHTLSTPHTYTHIAPHKGAHARTHERAHTHALHTRTHARAQNVALLDQGVEQDVSIVPTAWPSGSCG